MLTVNELQSAPYKALSGFLYHAEGVKYVCRRPRVQLVLSTGLVQANSVYGALRGLETFSQLIERIDTSDWADIADDSSSSSTPKEPAEAADSSSSPGGAPEDAGKAPAPGSAPAASSAPAADDKLDQSVQANPARPV